MRGGAEWAVSARISTCSVEPVELHSHHKPITRKRGPESKSGVLNMFSDHLGAKPP